MKHRLTLESALWITVAAVAVLFRMIHLSQPGLNDSEAQVALQAASLAGGSTVLAASHPLYVLLTGAMFALLGPTTFLARLLPALAGAGIAGVLYLGRKYLGRQVSLLAAFLAAVDPGFVAASRQADSPMPGMLLLFLFLVLFLNRKHKLAGAVLGLGLLSGLHFWQGFVLLAVTTGLYMLITGRSFEPWLAGAKKLAAEFFLQKGWISFLAVILLVGTLMFTFPGGAGEVLAGLTAYWQGWGAAFKDSITQYVLLLPSYELLFVAAGIGYGIHSILRGNRRSQFLMLSFLLALILTLVYPARNVLDMVWVVLPLLLLASDAIYALVRLSQDNWLPSAGLGLAVAILVTFALYSGLLIFTQGIGGQNMEIRIISLVGALVVAAILIILMAWAWSGPTGVAGLGMGLLALGVCYTIGQSYRAAGLGAFPEQELWRNSSRVVHPELLVSTLESISAWNNGTTNDTPIAVIDVDSPSLHWELRNFKRTDFYSAFPAGENPEIVITTIQSSPASSFSYTGQDLEWNSNAEWGSLTSQEWLNWYLKRSLPVVSKTVIVWGRTDIMPVGQSGTGELP